MKLHTTASDAFALGLALLDGTLPAAFATSVVSAFGNFRGIPTADTVAGEDFTVPAGQILVIEHVSLRATIDNADQVGFMRVFFDADGVGGTDELVLAVRTDLAFLPIGTTRKLVTYDWPVTIFAAPETDVVLNLNSTAGSSTGAAEWVVTGYLVPTTGAGLGR